MLVSHQPSDSVEEKGSTNLAFILSLYFNRICKGSPASRPFPNSYLNTYFIDVGPPISKPWLSSVNSNKHCPQTQDSFQVMQKRCVLCVSDRWNAAA